METHQIHILILFVSFALAVTILIDGVTNVAMAKSDFPNTPEGKVGFTDLMMYEVTVPVLSVFGLGIHIIGLHLDFISYIPETSTEGLFVAIGTLAHGALWLTMGSIWTACEAGALTVLPVFTNGKETAVRVKRGGPAFCPQHSFIDRGYSLEGPIPKLKDGLAWILFVLTLVALACASRGWMNARHMQYMEGTTRHRRTMQAFELPSYPINQQINESGKSATMEVIGSYETKV